MLLNQRHFSEWGYSEYQELVAMCRCLPILTRDRAMAFFDEAERVSEDNQPPEQSTSDRLFHGLGSALFASDTQSFDVRWAIESDRIADGVMVVETHDPVIAVLQCVARIGADAFLTRTFSSGNIDRVKLLVGAPATASVGQ